MIIRSIVIGWWPSHPAEPINGVMVSDHYHRLTRPLDKGWPMLPERRSSARTARDAGRVPHAPARARRPDDGRAVRPRRSTRSTRKKTAGSRPRHATIAECVSIHSAATWLIDNQPWDFFAVYYDAIDHFCHGFMKYHPPRRTGSAKRISTSTRTSSRPAYQLHDQMLGTLLNKAGDDTTVILMSDHGFHPDHLRPRGDPRLSGRPGDRAQSLTASL